MKISDDWLVFGIIMLMGGGLLIRFIGIILLLALSMSSLIIFYLMFRYLFDIATLIYNKIKD